MKNKIVLLISLILLLIIVFLTQNIINKSAANISPLKKDDFTSSPSATLRYFYEPKPNTTATSDDGDIKFVQTINSDTLNERVDYPVEKPPRTYRIIALGDSFTYGSFVSTQDSWPKKLEDMLNSSMKCSNIDKFEVINLGVPGYDTQYEVERFKRRGEKYNPDLVLWYFVDSLRMNELSFPITTPIINDQHGFKKGFNSTDPRARNIIAQARESIIDKVGEKNILNFQVEQMGELKKYFSGKVVVIPSPGLAFNYGSFLKEAADKNSFLRINKITNYYALDGSFLHDKTDPNGHPNQKGHQIIAEDLFNYLKSSNVISCKK